MLLKKQSNQNNSNSATTATSIPLSSQPEPVYSLGRSQARGQSLTRARSHTAARSQSLPFIGLRQCNPS